MSRTIEERLRSSDWWLEQAAHGWLGYGAAMLFSLPLALVFGPAAAAIGGAFSALVVATAREIAQNHGDVDQWERDPLLDALLDWTFTVVGGALEVMPWAISAWA